MGLYTAALDAGTEVSSTYEGRHLTVLETELIHPNHADDLVDKGDPVIVVLAGVTPHTTKAHAVGVALQSASATTDYIAVDTEGIWNLNVNADDDSGGATGAVNPGDPLYISDDSAASDDSSHDGVGDAVLSKIKNRNTQVPFGYALGQIDATAYGVIAVKVHWDPSIAEENVGVIGAPYADDVAAKTFRSYFYSSTGGTYPRGEDFELTIPNTSARVYEVIAKRTELTIPGDAWVCTGMISVHDMGLVITAGNEAMGTWSVLTLRFDNENTIGATNHANTYIHLRDAHEDSPGNQAISALFSFYDHDALDDGGVTVGHSILQDCNAAKTHNVSVACTYGAGNNRFWLMGHTTAPD